MQKKIVLILLLFAIQLGLFAQKGSSTIQYKVENGVWVSFNRFFKPVLPGKHFEVTLKSENKNSILISKSFEAPVSHESGKWRFIAPKKSGNYEISFTDTTSRHTFTLTLFVMTPISEMKGEYLNGYRIGHYPEKSLHGNLTNSIR